MSKPSAKKLRKQERRKNHKREERKQDEARRLARRRREKYNAQYPPFGFVPQNAPEEFVSLVRAAVQRINFEDRSVFPAWHTQVYRAIREYGWKTVVEDFDAIEKHYNLQGPFVLLDFIGTLGQAVFNQIPENRLLNHIPFSDVNFLPQGRAIIAVFQSLLRQSSPTGTVYYSSHRPTVEVNGQAKIVAFSGHAIQRACERIVPTTWKTYLGLGNAYGMFDGCMDYELCQLHGNQLGFTFFTHIPSWELRGIGVREVLGDSYDQDREYSLRVGYCPAVVEGDFIKAKTLLFPGHRTTPEYTAVVRSRMPWFEKRDMLKKMEAQDVAHQRQTLDFSLLRQFHELGIPQVMDGTPKLLLPLPASKRVKVTVVESGNLRAS
jgi:hypothetical protein